MGREGERESMWKNEAFSFRHYVLFGLYAIESWFFFIPVSLLLSVVCVVLFCLYRYTSFHNHDVSTNK